MNLIDPNLYLEKILNLIENPQNPDLQREKFLLLENLLTNLCKNTNNANQFKDILNLVILFLLTYKEDYQIDRLSESENLISLKERGILKDVLKKEIM